MSTRLLTTDIHQDRLLARADRSANAAEHSVRSVWRKLLAIMKAGGPWHAVYHEAAAVLHSLRFVGPDVALDLVAAGEAAARFTRHKLAPLLEDEPDTKSLLLPGPTLAQIRRVVYASGWWQRLDSLTALAHPEGLAARIASAVERGLSVAQIAREVRPLVQGIQTSARRVARIISLWVAHEVELATYEGLPDLVAGYQVNAVLDHATRPEHRQRDGQRFYRHPRRGQKGFDQMPRPPREADGSWAFNCRCWLEPILIAL